MLTSKLFVRNQ